MNIGIVGAGMAGLSAAWSLKRAGHRIMLFERSYKAGGRMSSRRRAGLVIDHGQRFLYRHASVLRELILDSGLHGELRTVDKPIYHLNDDGSYQENSPQDAIDSNRVVFAEGLLMLADALRRSVGGFYSMRVTSIQYDKDARQYIMVTDPPMRRSETQVDAVMLACPASHALTLVEPVQDHLNKAFLERMAAVQYTRCISLMAAMNEVKTPDEFYGLHLPPREDEMLAWLAFENLKCRGRAVDGWSSIVAHLTPKASERYWDARESGLIQNIYNEVSKYVPQMPDKWRWARTKRWDIARLANKESVIPFDECAAAPDNVFLEFCGDYRAGNGAELAAKSGRDAANVLLQKIGKPKNNNS